MSHLSSTSPVSTHASDASLPDGLALLDRGPLYLVLAAFLLVIALRFMKRALAPVGTLVHAVAAATPVVFAIGAALAFLVAAAVSGS
jgi:hypothetical protein